MDHIYPGVQSNLETMSITLTRPHHLYTLPPQRGQVGWPKGPGLYTSGLIYCDHLQFMETLET